MIFLRTKLSAKMFMVFCLFVILQQSITALTYNLEVNADLASTNYRLIDLYTQKEPYSGRGLNQPCDAFAPQEEVILYAYVTYRNDPVPGKIVAFEVNGPPNKFENFSFAQTAVTDDNGVANVSFRIPWSNGYFREALFGVWNAIAAVDIAGIVVNDTISFMVGWIIELVEIETVDINNVSKASFMRNEPMCFRLTVKNIAMTERTVTLIIEVYDNLSFSLGHIVLQDERLSPGITVLFVTGFSVPSRASLGEGVAYADAYTTLPMLGGVPYCPRVSTKFSIVKFVLHDVAVISVVPSVEEVVVGDIVDVLVVVRNEGDVRETFNVHAYYDSVLIGTVTLVDMSPRTEEKLYFTWCTERVSPGNYTLSAVADVVPGEVDIEDNRFVDGIVEIKPSILPPPPVPCVIPRWLIAFLFVIAVLVGLTLGLLVIFILLWLRRRREDEEEEVPISLPAKPSEGDLYTATKKCNVCGREFLSVYTFCPYCMSFHGKDYE